MKIESEILKKYRIKVDTNDVGHAAHVYMQQHGIPYDHAHRYIVKNLLYIIDYGYVPYKGMSVGTFLTKHGIKLNLLLAHNGRLHGERITENKKVKEAFYDIHLKLY